MAPEILRMILEFASPATLAACARASFALLEIASPSLYETVTLRSEEQLARLFCRLVSAISWRTLLSAFAEALLGEQDPSSRSDAISPHLCLSQIKRIHVTYLPSSDADEPELPTDRLPRGDPLAIQVLSLAVGPEITFSRPSSSAWRAVKQVNSHLVICDGPQGGLATVDGDHFSHMTRLRHLDLKSCRFYGWPAELPAFSFASPQDPLLVTYDHMAAPSPPPSDSQELESLSPFADPSQSWIDIAHAAGTATEQMLDGRLSFCLRFKTEDAARRALEGFDEEKGAVWHDALAETYVADRTYTAQLALDSPLLQRGLRVEYIGGVVHPFDSSYVPSHSLRVDFR